MPRINGDELGFQKKTGQASGLEACPVLFDDLECQLQGELPGAWRTLAADYAERRGGWVCAGVTQVRVVECVEAFCTELQAGAFPDREILDHGEVPARLARAPDSAEAKREGAQVAGELIVRVELEAGIAVEPAVNILYIVGERDVTQIAIEYVVAEAERRAGLFALAR